ncbi:MAG: isoprenylcysteine carboxylmethyltransferase family protein [Acidobacteria bacterium]|nr:isoprenylcysteine carboxylmethyltransferase family protein [Acidobacteriota bacterium]
MLVLQLYLLFGLVLHKVIWELLRRGSTDKPVEGGSPKLFFIKSVKIAILLGLVVQIWFPDTPPIMAEPFWLRTIGVSLFTLGLATAVVARLQLGDNWANIETGQILRRQVVVESGIYGFVRHPIYTGDISLLLGLELALNSWFVCGVLLLAPIVMMQAMKEEEMLVDALPGYERYCRRSKRFIPFVY